MRETCPDGILIASSVGCTENRHFKSNFATERPRQTLRDACAAAGVELAKLTKTNVDVAVAISSAPGFLSGISEERQRDLSIAAMRAHAPAEADRLLVADQVREEAERVESGLSKIKPAFYAEAIAGQMNTHVDVDAPFATGPTVTAAE